MKHSAKFGFNKIFPKVENITKRKYTLIVVFDVLRSKVALDLLLT